MQFILNPPIEPDEVIAGAIHVYKNVWNDAKNVIASIEKEASDPDSGCWEAPVAHATDVPAGVGFEWNEETLSWDQVEVELP